MIRRNVALTAVASAAALCLTGGAAAFAAVAPTASIVTTNGEAGYGATAPGTTQVTNAQTVLKATEYGTTVQQGALGAQISTAPVLGVCNAAQVGIKATLADSYKFTYGYGKIGSVANPCPAGGVINVADQHSFALPDVNPGDVVWVSVGTSCKVRHHHKHGYGNRHNSDWTWATDKGCDSRYAKHRTLVFKAQNLTTNTVVAKATLPDPATDVWVHASVGVSEDLSKLTGCPNIAEAGTAASPIVYTSATCHTGAEFNYATETIGNGLPVGLSTGPNAGDMAVAALAAGPTSAANPAVVDTHNTLSAVSAGVTGPATEGASAAGDSFSVFTANSLP